MSADFPTEDDTNDATSALTYLRIINDIHEAPDHPDAMKYLNAVQARTNRKEYISFVGVLKEFQEEIVREIDAKKEYVIKCALTLFQGQNDVILGLSEYIPKILDELESEQQEQQQQRRNKQIASEWQQQEWRQEPTTQTALEWSKLQELVRHESTTQMGSEWGNQEWQQVPLKQTASEWGKQEWQQKPTTEALASGWLHLQTVASVQWRQQQQEAMSTFIAKVRRRFLHSDQTACMKIEVALQEFFVDMTMPVHTAKKKMALLLQRHNDLWKEFEKFLPEELRAGSSDAGPANPL